MTKSGSDLHLKYDFDGSLINRNDTGTPPKTEWLCGYDFENGLTKATKNGQLFQQNFYDGDGKRVKKTESTTTVFARTAANLSVLNMAHQALKSSSTPGSLKML